MNAAGNCHLMLSRHRRRSDDVAQDLISHYISTTNKKSTLVLQAFVEALMPDRKPSTTTQRFGVAVIQKTNGRNCRKIHYE